MGNNLIVDFYGLPGCGKSTLSHLVAERLRDAGIHVSEVSYDMDHRHGEIMRLFLKAKFALLLLVHSPVTFSCLASIIKGTGLSLHSTSFYRQLLNIAYKVYAAKYRVGNGIQFYDEGFCQSVLSLYYNKENSYSEETLEKLELLLDEHNKVEYIFVRTDLSTTQKRLRNRQDGDSRVERLSDDNMTNILKKQELLCKMLPYSFIVDNKDGQRLTEVCDIVCNHINIDRAQ